ncbi:ABC-F family ATP-binding cassette domain-containing protein [bacterium]|nr:ABC-F family ATP-binding cassette domain-containing protein [bacterium]
MVLLENVSISFGGLPLFRGLDWRVGDRDRVGLVGPNGSGKTTLLRLIRKEIGLDEGRVAVSKGTTFGYLPQEELTLSGRSLLDEVLSVFEHILTMEDRMRELEHRMGELSSGDDPDSRTERERVMGEYSDLQHRFEAEDGFVLEARALEVLAGLGFSNEDQSRMTEEFSGGWQMRIALAKLLLEQPTVLLLDEPTNHLDLESIIWLEEYLSTYPGAVVLVSHDRSFLDRVATRISDLTPTGINDYTGGYTVFLTQREKQRDVMAATRKQEERRVAHLQEFVYKWKGDKKKANLVRSRQKMIQRITLTEVPLEQKGIHFDFPQPERGGAVTVSLRGVRQAYADRVIFDGVDFEVLRGERLALVGLNGAGKSTLMKVIADRIPILAGERKLGHNVSVQYFSQDPAKDLNMDNTVLGELETVASDEMRPRLRTMLGAFMFRGSDVDKKVRVLSGGEKSRLGFAKMLLRPANLLLLDEPTNHLDVASREVLARALSRYSGTICFVSHDRAFMNAIATKVVEVNGGNLRAYHGTYSDYLWAKEQEAAEAAGRAAVSAGRSKDAESGAVKAVRKGGGPKSKEQKRREARERQKRSGSKGSRRENRQKTLNEIEKSEKRLEKLDIELADPAVYSDGQKTKVLVTEQRRLKEQIESLYSRWAELED